jgi:hypothetical protein
VSRVLAWTLAAVAGLLLAVAVAYAASTLSSSHVGLSSEPLTAGDQLVPRAARPTRTPAPARTPTATPTASATATPGGPSPPPAGDDSSGDD